MKLFVILMMGVALANAGLLQPAKRDSEYEKKLEGLLVKLIAQRHKFGSVSDKFESKSDKFESKSDKFESKSNKVESKSNEVASLSDEVESESKESVPAKSPRGVPAGVSGLKKTTRFPGAVLIATLSGIQKRMCGETFTKTSSLKDGFKDFTSDLEAKLKIQGLPNYDKTMDNLMVAMSKSGMSITTEEDILTVLYDSVCESRTGLFALYHTLRIGLDSPSVHELFKEIDAAFDDLSSRDSYQTKFAGAFGDDLFSHDSYQTKIAGAIGDVICFRNGFLAQHFEESMSLLGFLLSKTETFERLAVQNLEDVIETIMIKMENDGYVVDEEIKPEDKADPRAMAEYIQSQVCRPSPKDQVKAVEQFLLSLFI